MRRAAAPVIIWWLIAPAPSCVSTGDEKSSSIETSDSVTPVDSEETTESCLELSRIESGYLSDDASGLVVAAETDGIGFGQAVSLVGDLSGDGFGDLVIGAPLASDADSPDGAVFLFLGPLTIGAMDSGASDHRFLGESGQQLGTALAGGADVDEDGLGDLLIGAPGGNRVAFLLSGEYTSDETTVEVATTISSEAEESGLGEEVKLLRDMDGDGIGDAAIGDTMSDRGGEGAGAVYIVFGPISPGVYALTDADMALLGTSGDGIGVVGRGGDFNGDGLDDLGVGAPESNEGQGQAWVVLGGHSLGTSFIGEAESEMFLPEFSAPFHFGQALTTVGDTDGDGNEDLAIGATYEGANYGTRLALYYGGSNAVGNYWLQSNDDSGIGISLSSGDMDNDGLGDFVVGGPQMSLGDEWPDVGAASIVYGDFSYQVGKPWMSPGAATGADVDASEDISGDGVADLVIGVPGAESGLVVVLSGCW